MDEETFERGPSPQPSFKLHSLEVDFIDNRLPAYHPAFDSRNVSFDQSRGYYVSGTHLSPSAHTQAPSNTSLLPSSDAVASLSPQPSPRPVPLAIKDLSFWSEVFPQAMKILNEETCPIKDGEWRIRNLSTWAEVETKLDDARKKYNHIPAPEQVGKVRRMGRQIMEKSVPYMQQGIRIVPEVDVAKPIVGAIKLVLDAYQQSCKVREELEDNFDNVPEAFEAADIYVTSFPGDQNIVAASTDLVHKVLIAVENAIAFFISHQVARAGKAIVSGPEYQKRLRGSLNSIKECCDRLGSQANRSFIHYSQSMLKAIHERHNMDSFLLQHMQPDSSAGYYWQDLQTHLRNCIMSVLQDLPREIASHSPVMRTPSPSPQAFSARRFWTVEDVWNCLKIPRLDEDDMNYVAARTAAILHEDGGTAQKLLKNRLFRNWIGSRVSAKLLVHGNCQPPGYISPLSAVCTLLSQNFRSSNNGFISLVFFCGQHLMDHDYHGPSAMIRSLISQLLLQAGFASFQAHPQYSLQDVERDSIEMLCAVFRWLIGWIPPSMTILCMIDGISLYEARFMDGMDTIILMLASLVDSKNRGSLVFKLLITSPRPTKEVRKIFDDRPNELLHMESLHSVGDGFGFSNLQPGFDY